MTPDERRAALDEIAAEVRSCTRCPLSIGRTNAVPGEGDPETEVVFVGEGPGFNEDQQGRPFVGAAGSLLNQLIGAIGWRRDQVFITNVVKCRPPGNRDPEPNEIAACTPYLRRQLEVLDPALVVTLGRHSLQTFMPGERIGQVHGTVRHVDPATGARDASVLAMYHPAAALRQHGLRQTMLDDICSAPQALIDSRARRAGDQSAMIVAATVPAIEPAAGPADPALEARAAVQPMIGEPQSVAVPAPQAAPAPQPAVASTERPALEPTAPEPPAVSAERPALEPMAPEPVAIPIGDDAPAVELPSSISLSPGEPVAVGAPVNDNQMELF